MPLLSKYVWHAKGESRLFGRENLFSPKKHLKTAFFSGQILASPHFGRTWRPNCWHQVNFWGTPNGCSRMRVGSCWHWMAFAGVWWCLTAAFSVLWCLEMWEGLSGVSQRVSELLLWTCLRFGFLPGSIWVFRPCLVQQLLYIGKSSKGKIPCTWHFWNIKIPKPPYISSLKIIGLLHFLKFLGLSEKNYNLQSIWITLYRLIMSYTDPVYRFIIS